MLFLVLFLWGGVPTPSPDFEALDPKVWEYGLDPEKGIYDAMVLKSSFTIEKDQILRSLTLRIFSEEGRSAAEVKMIGHTLKNLRGRVTTRDGQVSTFGEEDLIEALLVKTRRAKLKARMILPPGITSDCVVEPGAGA